ncbi:MAG: class I SAM-dependent methyltransferase [Opitutaceae bacterium]|jgi:SAM-dependent methyltransferase
MSESESQAVRNRYERRKTEVAADRYSLLNPDVWHGTVERQREMLRLFSRQGWRSVAPIKLLEIGCGSGGNLLEFLRLGFRPENLTGIELLEDRVEAAQRVLPGGVVRQGDALAVGLPVESFDVVFQSVVFSSLLDDKFQQDLARRMWSLVKPGGGVLWYDFIYNNPKNPDVRGVSIARIRELFPQGDMVLKRVTLAPPVARRVCKVYSGLYPLFNALPFLRSHVLVWIRKPA